MGLKELSDLPDIDSQPSLIVLDSLDYLSFDESSLFKMLQKASVHVVVLSKNSASLDLLQKEIDQKLLRGITVVDVHPLTPIHTTQRMVHSILKEHHLAPSMADQTTFEKLAEFTSGSPAITEVASSLLDLELKKSDSTTEQALCDFAINVQLSELPQNKPQTVVRSTDCQPSQHMQQPAVTATPVRDISQCLHESIQSLKDSKDAWITSSNYDSWQVMTVLIRQYDLSPEEQLLLNCLSHFHCSPIPIAYIIEISAIITKASHQRHLASSLHAKLKTTKLMTQYPKPVVFHPTLAHSSASEDVDFMYVPKFIAEAVQKDMMSDIDKVMSVSIIYKAFQNAVRQPRSSVDQAFLLGICSLLFDSYELHFKLVGRQCFQEVYILFLSLQDVVNEHSLKTVVLKNSTIKRSEFDAADRTRLKLEDNLHSTVEQREHKDTIRKLAELLHAEDYPRIFPIAYKGKPPHTLHPELQIPYIFITGLAYYKLSSHKKSVQYFQQCLQLAEEWGRDGDVTICCIYIGDIEFAQRKYNEAAERYKKALHYYSRDSVAKDFRMILPTQSALWSKCGSAFKNASKMADSITAYNQAIEEANSKKDKLAAHTSLGNLYQGIGENKRAEKEYEDAIQLAAELDDKVSLGWNHGNLGNTLLGLYHRDKAFRHLFKALDMALEHEATLAIGRAYNDLGTAYQVISDYSEAEKYYDFALKESIDGNDDAGQARLNEKIGNLQMLKKEYDRAVPHYTEVIRLSQDKSTVTTAHHNRGCAYYYWAEKKKMALYQGTSPKKSIRFKVSFYGPQFEHCEDVYMPTMIPNSIQEHYLQGTKDLEYDIKHHEESCHGIKGSSKGLSLSVSLFETNSRIFHRMQDCLIHLKMSEDEPCRFEDALLVAEQSRARTLGELLLSKRGPQLKHQLMSPPSLAQLKSIVARQSCPVVYLSYTGERLLGWVLVPTTAGECSLNMFEVPLSDSEFDGKSFDYHLRYSLNELLVEKSFEMYKPFNYEKEQTDPMNKLYNLVAKPLITMLNTLQRGKRAHEGTRKEVQKIIIVPDSYTNLLPYACLLNENDEKFWGDEYYFQIMPSLLTMGILDQLPTVSVTIPVEHQQMICVVGNPTIPPFKYNNDEWNLGKLPHATKEAEWVAHILKSTPILHEEATKIAVMMRAVNAKVIHLATHAVADFLVFAGTSSTLSLCVSSKDVEKLSINPILVVLSVYSNASGGSIPDRIQKMIQAFILAGAQAILTTLWRVPDESACIFMQFFYQYLVDGVRGTEALHKAMLSVRCFSKYSQYIHWSGYQLTGKEFQFSINESSSAAELTTRLGCNSIFSQLDVLKKFKNAFLNDPRLPTDIQVLISCILYSSIVNLLLLR